MMNLIEVFAPEVLLLHPSEPIRRAVREAAEMHAGQFRKYVTGLPYVTHPYGVAVRLLGVGADEATIIAGLFHDAVEDKTPMSLVRLERDYGVEVAQLVSSVSDRWPASTGLSREERKRLYRTQVVQSEPRAHTLKLADNLDNVEGIVARDRRFAKVYLPEVKAMAEALVLGHAGLRQEVMAAVEREMELLQQLA